jgi:hypothetical protein
MTAHNPGTPAPLHCDRGDNRTARFRFTRGSQDNARCFRHAVTFRPIVRTAILTSLVVGSVLTLINHGDALLAGDPSAQLLWKLPLTYAVPYSVATWSALRLAWQPSE